MFFTIRATAQQERIDLKIVVNTGEGHRAEWLLPADEYLEEKGGGMQSETAVSFSRAAVHTAKDEEQSLLGGCPRMPFLRSLAGSLTCPTLRYFEKIMLVISHI